MTPRDRILTGRPLPALLRLALPNLAASLVQSLMIVTEGWYVGGLGGQALAGVALVFPLFMLTMMLSAGAIGGAVSGAMARAVGARDTTRANAVLRLAVLISLVAGAVKAALMLVFGTVIFRALGGQGDVLAIAERYAEVLFPAIVLLWLTNMMASALRGTGDMVRPAIGVFLVVAVHFVLIAVQRVLDYPLGVAGAAWAILGAYLAGLVFIAAVLAGRGRTVRLSAKGWTGLAGGWRLVGAGLLAGSQSIMTIAYTLIVTGVFARFGQHWLAGYGVGARLELLLIPIVFGIGGATMVATGTLVGAGRREDAVRTAWMASLASAAILGAIGVALAVWPVLWTGLFTTDPKIAEAGSAYLLRVGPAYAAFGLGLCLYFASQGLETLFIPVVGALLRVVLVAGGFWMLGQAGMLEPAPALWVVVAAMLSYGGVIAAGLALGPWRQVPREQSRVLG